MFPFFSQLDTKKKFIFLFLSTLVIGFLIQSIFKGLNNSCDILWQPTNIFWNGINHYEYQLRTRDIFLGCQKGQYGHFIFILFYPLTFFEWEQVKILWMIVNIILAISIPILICRSFNLPTITSLLILGFFLTSHPTRMTFNLGQNSLMIFFFLMLPFITLSSVNKNARLILSGTSYVKYNTGYILFLNLLIEKKYKELFLTTLLTIFGWLFYSYYTETNLIESFIDPFKFIIIDKMVRTGDLYSIMNIYLLKETNLLNKIIQLSSIIFLNIYFLYQIKDTGDKLAKLAVICILPLIFMPHGNYDYVLLLPTLIYGIKNFKLMISKYCVYLSLYYFYFHRIVKHKIDNDMIYQNLMFIVFLIFIIFFCRHIKKLNHK